MSKNYDNWERLVGAVLRREHDKEVAMAPSRDPSNLSSASSALDHSYRSTSPFRHHPRDLLLQVRKKTWPSIALAWWRSRQVQENSSDLLAEVDYPEVHLGQLKRFSLRELQIATDNFSNGNILGRGGFGNLYKGFLADGLFIAVKRLKEERTPGSEIQFQTELEMLSQAVHRNIVRLLGFCMTANERMLVYPYFAKGSVASCLRERPKNEPPLDWPTRKLIALGSARGLSYLHNHFDTKIIHRDVKSANIFLDEEFEAVLMDFGLAKLINDGDTDDVCGTLGHIAPEYLSKGKLSEKTDVFGYGVMLLELITGQRAFDLRRLANDDDVMMLDWVKRVLEEKKLEILVDPELQNNYVEAEVEELLKIALLCTRDYPTERPKMSEVVRVFVEGDELAKKWDELLKEEKSLQEMHSDQSDYDDTENLAEVGYPEVHLGQLKRFSLQELQIATDDFSNRNVLGRGGFGKMHKGRLADGSFISVKRLKKLKHGGEIQFHTEVEMLSQAVHHNIVRLLGFCMTPTERMLVYPYFAKGSVASCLRERTPNEPPLDWPTRMRIAMGSARGLSYLHDFFDPKIIHRDVKAANIFLDEEFEAVLTDFGLAKLINDGDTDDVCGTLGHIAPEYLSKGKLSEKTDVFGYGVTLLELITGQRAFDLGRLANEDGAMMLDWVEGLLKLKKLEILVDPDLQDNYVEAEVEVLIKIALICTQGPPRERPKMSEVERLLVEGDELAKRWDKWQ